MATEVQRPTEVRTGGGNGFLYFIVGALLVAVAVLGVLYFNGNVGASREDVAIERSADAIGDAARDIGDAAKKIPNPAPAPAPDPNTPVVPPT